MALCGRIVKRSFSLSSIRQFIKPPVQVHGIEGRYASALYSAAAKEKKLESVEKELKSMQDLYQKDGKFKEFVLDPTVQAAGKKKAMEEILKKLGVSGVAMNFFGVIAENGRLGKLDVIVKSFDTIMSAHRGELFCQVTTAKELDTAGRKQLDEALKNFAKQNQKLQIVTKVDAALIAGMIVTVGDKYVDMSLATKIKKYTDAMNAVI